jgi:type II secretory pathway pseudopilin PulG
MMFKRLRLINKNQTGITLLELLLAVAIATIVTSTAVMIVFQVFDGEARSSNHINAISRVQNAGCQVSTDAGMAQRLVLTPAPDLDGFPLTLSWTEWESNEVHQVVYSIVDNELQREHYINGGLDTTYVFEHIYNTDPDTGELKTYCEWDEDNLTLAFTLTAIVGVGSQKESETRVYEAKPRPSI